MILNDNEYKKVSKIIKKKLLKEDAKYQQCKVIFTCGLLTTSFLTFATGFFAGDITGVIAKFMLMPSSFITLVSGAITGLGRYVASAVAKRSAFSISSLYSNIDDLIDSISDTPMYERKKNMNNSVGYTKDGKPFIDVDYVEIPDSEASDIEYEPILDPGIIDVDYYPLGEITLSDNIKFLMEYVEDVAYPNFEADLMVLDTMLEYVTSGKIDDLTKASLENTLNILADNILNQACKHYNLPLVRKKS